jgi:hypothetical protein
LKTTWFPTEATGPYIDILRSHDNANGNTNGNANDNTNGKPPNTTDRYITEDLDMSLFFFSKSWLRHYCSVTRKMSISFSMDSMRQIATKMFREESNYTFFSRVWQSFLPLYSLAGQANISNIIANVIIRPIMCQGNRRCETGMVGHSRKLSSKEQEGQETVGDKTRPESDDDIAWGAPGDSGAIYAKRDYIIYLLNKDT